MDRNQRWNLKQAKKAEKDGDLTYAAHRYSDAGMNEKAGDLLTEENVNGFYAMSNGQRLHYAVEYYLKGRCFEKALNTWIKLISIESGWSKDDFEELKDHFGLKEIISRAKDYNPFELAYFLETKGFLDEALNICSEYEEKEPKCRIRIGAIAQRKAKIYEKNCEFLKAADMFEHIGQKEDAIKYYRMGKKWEKVEELIYNKYENRDTSYHNYPEYKYREIIEIYLEEKEWNLAEEYVSGLEGDKRREDTCRIIVEFYIDNVLFENLREWFDRSYDNIDQNFNGIHPHKGIIKGFKWGIDFKKTKFVEQDRIEDLIYYAKKLKEPYWAVSVDRPLDEVEIRLRINAEIEGISNAFQHIDNERERKEAINMIKKSDRLDELVKYYKKEGEDHEIKKINKLYVSLADGKAQDNGNKKFCPNPECNTEIQKGWKRCPNCGAKLTLIVW
jgi:hypothetical protein